METEKAPTQPKHEHRGKDTETKKEGWTAPRIREVRTRATEEIELYGADGGEADSTAS